MSAYSGSAPSWLFSFVDLAFLSLIAMTQITANAPERAIDIGDMVVPRIGGEKTSGPLAEVAVASWQLRVYPRTQSEENPFALVQPRPDSSEAPSASHIDAATLRLELSKLERQGLGVPLLAPHQKSLSQDFLQAASLIEEFWPTHRRALVAHHLIGS